MLKNFRSLDYSNEPSEIRWSHGRVNLDGLILPHSRIIRLSNETYMRVHYDKGDYGALLDEKFTQVQEGESKNVLGEIYFQTISDKIGIGLVDGGAKQAVVRGAGFGIFKSVISGLASYYGDTRESPLLPIHGAAISHERAGNILLIGGHGAGKTTTLVNLAKILGCGRIASDDWLNAGVKDGSLSVDSPDCSISVSKKFLDENAHLDLPLNVPDIGAQVAARKVSFAPHVLLGQTFSSGGIEGITKIIILTNQTRNLVWKVLQPDGIGTIFTSTAYHYPYNQSISEIHEKTWESQLRNLEISYYLFNGRHAQNMPDGYRQLVEVLMGK